MFLNLKFACSRQKECNTSSLPTKRKTSVKQKFSRSLSILFIQGLCICNKILIIGVIKYRRCIRDTFNFIEKIIVFIT